MKLSVRNVEAIASGNHVDKVTYTPVNFTPNRFRVGGDGATGVRIRISTDEAGSIAFLWLTPSERDRLIRALTDDTALMIR